MKIYLDLVFFVNFAINLIFIYIIQLIFSDQFLVSRSILSSILASLLLISFLFDKIFYMIFKICGGVILVFIGIGARKLAIKTSLFYLLQFSLTGIVSSFKISGMYLIIALFIVIILIMIESFKKNSIFLNQFKYNVSVTFLGKQLFLKGFLDTGNFITVDGMPVIFINKKFYQKGLEISKIVKIKTINNEKKVLCYSPEKFNIFIGKKKVNKNVLVSFANLGNEFDCLLNYHLFF